MRRRTALRALGASAIGATAVSGAAAQQAKRPDLVRFKQGAEFPTDPSIEPPSRIPPSPPAAARFVTTDARNLRVQVYGGVLYPETAKTGVQFGGVDPKAPGQVDVASFGFDRGLSTGPETQTVTFVAVFDYSPVGEIDDPFPELVGDTPTG